MVAKANMTSIRENLIFLLTCIAQNQGLTLFHLHKYLLACDDLWLIWTVIVHGIIWHA